MAASISTTWTPSTYTTGYTNLGSLTPTSFPSDCLQSLWDFQTTPLLSDIFSYQTQGCAVSSCCPSGQYYTESWAWMTSYFSPGVCPSQYRSCSPPPATAQTVLSSQPGETVVFCCPTNYACPYTVPPSGEPYFLFCQSLMMSTTTSVVVMDNIFHQSTLSTRPYTLATMYNGQYQLAYPIQIRMGGSSTTPSSTVGSSQTRSTTTTSATDISPINKPAISRTSLSGGVIAGIAIGAFFVGILTVTGIGLLIYRRRSRSKQPPAAARSNDGSAWIVEHKAGVNDRNAVSMALPTQTASELDARGRNIAELPSRYR